MWKFSEKRPFFRADMAGLGIYHMGGFGRIGVYRVKLLREVFYVPLVEGVRPANPVPEPPRSPGPPGPPGPPGTTGTPGTRGTSGVGVDVGRLLLVTSSPRCCSPPWWSGAETPIVSLGGATQHGRHNGVYIPRRRGAFLKNNK